MAVVELIDDSLRHKLKNHLAKDWSKTVTGLSIVQGCHSTLLIKPQEIPKIATLVSPRSGMAVMVRQTVVDGVP
jgi:hypothetical protein